jgi:hypothetical protein
MNPPITAEALLAKLKVLPPERLGQIADFVDFLTTQEQCRQGGRGTARDESGHRLVPCQGGVSQKSVDAI